jgi:hypothetical protein
LFSSPPLHFRITSSHKGLVTAPTFTTWLSRTFHTDIALAEGFGDARCIILAEGLHDWGGSPCLFKLYPGNSLTIEKAHGRPQSGYLCSVRQWLCRPGRLFRAVSIVLLSIVSPRLSWVTSGRLW